MANLWYRILFDSKEGGVKYYIQCIYTIHFIEKTRVNLFVVVQGTSGLWRFCFPRCDEKNKSAKTPRGPDAQVLKKVSFQADSNQAAASVA